MYYNLNFVNGKKRLFQKRMSCVIGIITITRINCIAMTRYGYWPYGMFKKLGIPGPKPSPFFGSLSCYKEVSIMTTPHFKMLMPT